VVSEDSKASQGQPEAGRGKRVLPHRELGLTDEEARRIAQILGREPNLLELAMYAVMWSEHCSYKSSRLHLRRLPTRGAQVLVGPGENAGVVDIGDGIAAAIRIESHNHPSAVEPFHGAATGVGGIIRDIFTMGARPIALMDPLFFGPLDDPRNRWLFEGVVSGISAYGNSVGVPTVGGELTFAPGYSRNPLVNVLALGLMPTDRIALGRARGQGNLAVLLGSTTGRDGIGGVSVLASAGFAEQSEADTAKRPSVQVGDPFEEKRLIEACIEMLGRGLVVGIQDLGGGGLTCAASETAARAGMGMDVYVSAVSRREPNMEPFEVMTSESQERMLAIVTTGDLDAVKEVCERWEIRAAVVGEVTAPTAAHDAAGDSEADSDSTPQGRLRIFDHPSGELLADVPAASLSEDAPLYARPLARPAAIRERTRDDPGTLAPPEDCGADLLRMLRDTSWVYAQYDHQLFLNTVLTPGADAAVLRAAGPGIPASRRAIALSTDSNQRWCALDPRLGTTLVVCESALNVACAGATPLALVNCLNFGNPEHPEVMWQLSESIDGMAEAAEALGIPVVGGNVSLYNESGGVDIDPTPVVATLGVIERLERRPPRPGFVEGGAVVLLGETTRELGGSRWAVELRSQTGGVLPGVDLDTHKRTVELVARLVGVEGLVAGVHDVSDGGLAVALAECALSSGVGLVTEAVRDHAELFGEPPSRVVLCTPDADEVLGHAERAGIGAQVLGIAGGTQLEIAGFVDLEVSELAGAWRSAIPASLTVPA
jgi:phosphoribosylformylglycinamidine synthase subunit PurL